MWTDRANFPGRTTRLVRWLAALPAAGLALLTATVANAIPLSVTTGTTTNVAAGSTLDLAFDIGSAVAGLGLASPATLASGSMTFHFADDWDSQVVTSQTTRNFRTQLCGPGFGTVLCYPLEHFDDTTYRRSVDPLETASVTSGGATAAASSTLTNYVSSFDYPVRATHQSCGWAGCVTVEETVSVRTCGSLGCATEVYPLYRSGGSVGETYSGAFSLTMALSAIGLADLAADGILPFSIAATLGDFDFLSASLSVDVLAGSVGETPVGVPEPASALLLTLGLVGVGVARVRRARPDLRRVRPGSSREKALS